MDTTTLAPGNFYYKFDHSLIKTQRNVTGAYHYNTAYKNLSPGFKDASNNDYRLVSSSVNSINMGSTLIVVPVDLNGQFRDALPDLGAYEYIP